MYVVWSKDKSERNLIHHKKVISKFNILIDLPIGMIFQYASFSCDVSDLNFVPLSHYIHQVPVNLIQYCMLPLSRINKKNIWNVVKSIKIQRNLKHHKKTESKFIISNWFYPHDWLVSFLCDVSDSSKFSPIHHTTYSWFLLIFHNVNMKYHLKINNNLEFMLKIKNKTRFLFSCDVSYFSKFLPFYHTTYISICQIFLWCFRFVSILSLDHTTYIRFLFNSLQW